MTRFVRIAGTISLKLIGVICLFVILIGSFVIGIITLTVVSITFIFPESPRWLAKRSSRLAAWFNLIKAQGRGKHTGTFTYVFLVSGLLCYRSAYKVIAAIFFKEKRRLAANPETAPETLRELSKSFDPLIHKAIAGNPNTPIDILWELIPNYPGQILENPVWPLITMANPNWIEEIPEEKLIDLLKKPGIPRLFVDAGISSNSRYIREAVAEGILSDPQSSVEQLESLVLAHQRLYPQMLTHPSFKPELLLKFMMIDSYEIHWTLCNWFLGNSQENYKLKDWRLQDQILDYIINHCKESFAQSIISCYESTLDDARLKHLCLKLPHNHTIQLARSASAPRVLEFLAECPIADNRQQIQMIKALIQNPETPKSLLYSFSVSPNQAIRSYIARYAPLTVEMFANLAIDPFPKTQNNLLQNRKIPSSIIHDLTQYPNLEVQKLANQWLKCRP